MTDIIVLLGAATLVAVVFHVWKLPPIVAFFTAGALVGPHGFALIQSPPQVELMTEGAAILLMFTIGLEFSLKTFSEFRRPLILLGAGQVIATVVIFFGLFSSVFGLPFEKALFFSFMTSLSSTAVVLKLLSENRDLETPHGKAGLSILLSQDIAVIPMIITIPFLYKMNEMAASLLESILPITLIILTVLGALYLLNKYILPMVLVRVAQTKSREVFFFSLVFFVASIAYLMHLIGLSVSLGAFIAGMLIAGSAYGKQATADFVPLRDAFLGLFFVTIGMLLDLGFLFSHLHWILLIGIPLLAIKALIIFLVVWFAGNTGNISRVSSLLLFQLGEFSFILADQGLKLNLLNQMELQYFIAISILSLAITPLVYRYMSLLNNSALFNGLVPKRMSILMYKLRTRYLANISGNVDLEAISALHSIKPHVLLIGYGVAGRSLAKALKTLETTYSIIEANSETVRAFQNKEPIIYGDASSPEILEQAGIEHCKLAVVVTSGISTLEPVIRSIRKLKEDIPIIARTNYILDLQRIKDIPLTDVIVSELETTLEIVSNTLNKLDTTDETLAELLQELKLNFKERQNV